MPAPNFSEPLAWADSPLENPLAIYDVNFATALTYNWTELRGYFGKVELRPKFVCIDNLDSDQFLNAYFDNVRYPVNAFQRLTVPVPPNARGFQLIGDATSLLTCEVIFAIDDISKADTINFKQIQNSGTEGVLWPLFNQSGPKNFIGSDDHTIHKFIITGATAVNLPDPLTVSNGWVIQVWNDDTSTANITLAVTGGADIDGLASLTISPGEQYWFVEDGANAFTVLNANIINPRTQIFTAGGTWTPTFPNAQLDYIEVEGVGGGGGGGGAGTTGRSAGCSGASGAWGFKKILAAALNLAGETVTIGAAGAASAAGANPGGNGGTTSFGAHMSLTGGTGGAGNAGVAGGNFFTGGPAGGTATGADIAINGASGGWALGNSTGVLGFNMAGGSNPLGQGGIITSNQANGNQGTGFGCGGSGGAEAPAATNRSGAAGHAGIIIVREYYK